MRLWHRVFDHNVNCHFVFVSERVLRVLDSPVDSKLSRNVLRLPSALRVEHVANARLWQRSDHITSSCDQLAFHGHGRFVDRCIMSSTLLHATHLLGKLNTWSLPAQLEHAGRVDIASWNRVWLCRREASLRLDPHILLHLRQAFMNLTVLIDGLSLQNRAQAIH